MAKSIQVKFGEKEELFQKLCDALKSQKAFVRNALIEYFLDPQKRVVFFDISPEEAKQIVAFIEGKDANVMTEKNNNDDLGEDNLAKENNNGDDKNNKNETKTNKVVYAL